MRRQLCVLMVFMALGLFGCDQHPSKQAESLRVVAANNQTYLIDEDTRKVFVFRENEFVQTPIISLNDFVGKKATKLFMKEVPNFSVMVYLKYRSGQVNYQITVLPLQDKGRYKLENWIDYLKSPNNMLNINLHDSDGFIVQSINLAFGGIYASPRTTLVDDQGNPTSVEFDGTLATSVSTFELIGDADVTYVLQAPTSSP
jgi:hypothetical protein